MEKHFKLILLLILLGSFLVRILGISWGVPSKNLSLTTYHPDEAITLYPMERMKERGDLYPGDALWWGSLHYYVTGAVLLGAKACGLVSLGNRSNLKENLRQADRLYIVGRLLSVIAGLVSVVLMGLMGRLLFGDLAGLLAAALFGFYPATIASDHFLKPDSFFLTFALLGLWFAFKLVDKGSVSFKEGFFLGVCFGLSAASKYTGFLFWPLAPVVCALVKGRGAGVRGFVVLSLVSIFGLCAAFVLTCPYSVLKFDVFYRYLTGEMLHVVSKDSAQQGNLLGGIYHFCVDYLPFATSWPTTVFGLFGIIFCLRIFSLNSRLIFLVGSLITLLVLSFAQTKCAIYSFPFLPFLTLGCAACLSWLLQSKYRWFNVAALLILVAQIVEGVAVAKLFAKENTRELASQWLLKHVPVGSEVGIIRSYYWTPPILRAYESPYKVLKGGDDHSNLHEAVLGWANQALPSYFVLSESEVDGFLKGRRYWSVQASVLDKIFSSYESVAIFSERPTLLGLQLWRRDPPYDFLYISPTIQILRKLST